MKPVYEQLTVEEKSFLKRHGIPINSVIDAKGMRAKDYQAILKDKSTQYKFALNVSPCKKYKHRLKNASGHCIQCNPSYLRYEQRYTESAFVYVAAPNGSSKICKVGMTNNIENRQRTLTSDGYAGESNWEIIFSIFVDDAGRIENLTQKALSIHKDSARYKGVKDNRDQESIELFICEPALAICILQETINIFASTEKNDTSQARQQINQQTNKQTKNQYNSTEEKFKRPQKDNTDESKKNRECLTSVVHENNLSSLQTYQRKLEMQRARLETELCNTHLVGPSIFSLLLRSKSLRILLIFLVIYIMWRA